MDKKEVGQVLREKRKQSGLKWDAILSALKSKYGIEIARSTIFGYENGHASPTPQVLMALCDLYGIQDLLHEFGVSAQQMPTLKSDGIEEIVIFENEYTPENWQMIKNFISLVPAKDKK